MSIINEQLIALVNGAKQKDTKAIEFLYNEFYGDIYYTCYKILGNQEDAKDMAQETFLEAFISIDSLREPLSFKYWINRIATNKSFYFLKRYNRINIQNVDYIEQLSNIEDIQARPEDVIIEADVKNTLENIMARLPEEQRTTLFLFYYQEMTTKEIAELYQCPESTIKSRLAYARKFMRKEVEKFEDNGYKLRCLTALPFIFALFNTQKSTTSIVGKGNIIEALNAYVASIPIANANFMNNNANTIQQQPIQTSNISNNICKISSISKTTKITIAIVSTVIVLSSTILAGVLIHNKNKSKIPTDQDTVSSINTESESNIDDNSQVVSSESSILEVSDGLPKTLANWEFRDIPAPTFEDSEYIEVKPYTEYINMTDEERNKVELTSSPSFKIDLEKAENFIKNNRLINDEFEIGEGKVERQELFHSEDNVRNEEETIGVDFKYNIVEGISGYHPNDYISVDERTLFGGDFRFISTQSYSQYNTPNLYEFYIDTYKASQKDIYNMIKEIFGENIAEWAVYSKTDADVNETSLDTLVDIYTPNGKCKYLIERYIRKNGEDKSCLFYLKIKITDEGATLIPDSGYYEHYANGYVPMDMNISLDNLFSIDVDGTDLTKPKGMFNNIFNSTGVDNEYNGTLLTEVKKEYMRFEDGTIYNSYNIEGAITIKDKYSIATGKDKFSISVGAYYNKDGSLKDIINFEVKLPTGRFETLLEGDNEEVEKQVIAKVLDTSIKKVSEVFEISEKDIKDNLTIEGDLVYSTIGQKVTILGMEKNIDIAFFIYYKSIGNVKIIMQKNNN